MMQKFFPRTIGLVFQRKCVAISPKTVATDRSQLRSTQKLFPTTQTQLPATEKRCERWKIPPADPAELFSNANALRSVSKRLQRTDRSCDRHENFSRRPKR